MGNWTDVYTTGDLLARAVDRYSERDALVFPDRRATFSHLDARAVEAARALVAMGVGKGDHVGILMPNQMEFVEVMLGANLIGAWAVPINSRYKARELAYVVENADLKVLFTSDINDEHVDLVVLLHDALPGLESARDPMALALDIAPALRSVVLIGGKEPAGMVGEKAFRALAPSVGAQTIDVLRSRVAVRDVAIMMYTSGTTANPKGCPLSHEALVRTAIEAGRKRFQLTETDRMWDPLPMFHMSFCFRSSRVSTPAPRCSAWSDSSPPPPSVT